MNDSQHLFPDSMSLKLRQSGVVAVLVIDDPDHAAPLAKTLFENGIGAMELTLRTPAAVAALKAVRAEVPEMLAGIGTILTPDQVREVADAGAEFGVSPGMNPRVVRAAREIGLPFAPGIATPSELENAIEEGCRTVKFFPAATLGGVPHLKSMASPYAHLGIQYIPLGGVNLGNLAAYLGEDSVPAVGGSWIATRNLINDENWKEIAANASEARRAVDDIRGM
jgi:2-dehydro-3-deoxyphosphogluconate aldolase/(4S)-4-hydroxy-2-oxoglutarate aldolase